MSEEKKYSYQRFGCNSTRVGQAALDILSQVNPTHTVEEILDEFGKDYLNQIQQYAAQETKKYEGKKFYIFSLLHKDLTAFRVDNVVRHWMIARKTEPNSTDMLIAYPHHTKTLYEVVPAGSEITLLWTVPGWEDCKSIMKNPSLYDRDLVTWTNDAMKPFQSEKAS